MHISQIDANLLVVLDALLRESNVTRAARRVGLSQSAMSHALARLRDHLGDPLLVRAGRKMVLTPKAEALAPRVHHIVDEMDKLLSPDEGFDTATLVRAFRLHATDHVQLVLVPELDTALQSEAPNVDLHIAPIYTATVDELRAGACDAAIGVFTDLPPDIHEKELFIDRFVCLVRADHPATKRALTVEQYAALPHLLVAPRGVPRGIVDDHLERIGLKRRVARSVPHFLVAPFLVTNSDYVLTISERLAVYIKQYLNLRIVQPPVELPSYALQLIWHRRHAAEPAHVWFRDTISRVAAALPELSTQKRRQSR